MSLLQPTLWQVFLASLGLLYLIAATWVIWVAMIGAIHERRRLTLPDLLILAMLAPLYFAKPILEMMDPLWMRIKKFLSHLPKHLIP